MSEPTKATPDLLLWIDSINKIQVNESVLCCVTEYPADPDVVYSSVRAGTSADPNMNMLMYLYKDTQLIQCASPTQENEDRQLEELHVFPTWIFYFECNSILPDMLFVLLCFTTLLISFIV